MELIEKINNLKTIDEIEKFNNENKMITLGFCIYHNIKNIEFVFYHIKKTIETIENTENNNDTVFIIDAYITDILLKFEFTKEQYIYILDKYSNKPEFIEKNNSRLIEKLNFDKDVLLTYFKIIGLLDNDKNTLINLTEIVNALIDIDYEHILYEIIKNNKCKFIIKNDNNLCKFIKEIYTYDKELCKDFVFNKLLKTYEFYNFIYNKYSISIKNNNDDYETKFKKDIDFINEIIFDKRFVDDKMKTIKNTLNVMKENNYNIDNSLFSLNFNDGILESKNINIYDIDDFYFIFNEYKENIKFKDVDRTFTYFYDKYIDSNLIDSINKSLKDKIIYILNFIVNNNEKITLEVITYKYDEKFIEIFDNIENIKKISCKYIDYFISNNDKLINSYNIDKIINIFNLDDEKINYILSSIKGMKTKFVNKYITLFIDKGFKIDSKYLVDYVKTYDSAYLHNEIIELKNNLNKLTNEKNELEKKLEKYESKNKNETNNDIVLNEYEFLHL